MKPVVLGGGETKVALTIISVSSILTEMAVKATFVCGNRNLFSGSVHVILFIQISFLYPYPFEIVVAAES